MRALEFAQELHDQRFRQSFRVPRISAPVCPGLEATAEQVHPRLGIPLRLDLADTAITVSAPKRVGSIRRASHPYSFDISEFN